MYYIIITPANILFLAVAVANMVAQGIRGQALGVATRRKQASANCVFYLHFQKWSWHACCVRILCGVPPLQVLALDFHPHLVNHKNPVHYSHFHSEIHNMTTMSNIYALPKEFRNMVCSASITYI